MTQEEVDQFFRDNPACPGTPGHKELCSAASVCLLHSQEDWVKYTIDFTPVIRHLCFVHQPVYFVTFKLYTPNTIKQIKDIHDFKKKMLDSVKKALGPCTFGFYVKETIAKTDHVHVLIATAKDLLKLHGKPYCNKRGFLDVRVVTNDETNKLKVFNYMIKESYKKMWKRYKDYNHTKIPLIFL